WLGTVAEGDWISGPGIRGNEERLAGRFLVDAALREPHAKSILRLGLERWKRGETDDINALEPLYPRPSPAEENQTPLRGVKEGRKALRYVWPGVNGDGDKRNPPPSPLAPG